MIVIDKHEDARKLIRAVIYIRFSSKQQMDSFSIEYQQEECLKYIERKGYKFVGEYIDKAKTGKSTAGREALEEMLFDAGRNKFDRIIVFSFSRSFRNTRDALNTNHELMEKHGVIIESVIEPIDMTSPHGKFSGTNLFAMHELQSDIIAAHVRSGMYIAAKQGYYLGGQVPFGYDLYETGELSRGKPRKKYCINEAETEIIQWLFKMFVDGFSYGYIQQELMNRNLTKRSGELFSHRSLQRYFKNPFYIGIREYEIKGYDPLYIENAVPAIIDMDTWNAAQERLKTQSEGVKPRKKKRLYMLTGKLECGCCGGNHVGIYKPDKRKPHIGGYAYYICRNKKLFRTCSAKNLRKDHIEEYCINQIKKFILTPEKIKEIAAYIVSQTDGTPDLVKEEFETAEKRKRKVLDIIKKMKRDMYEMDEAEAEAQQELIAEYSKELTMLNEKLARLENIESSVISFDMVENYLNECMLNIDSPDPHIVKSVFDKLIEKIVVHDDKVVITLIVFPFASSVLKQSNACPCYALSTDSKREDISPTAWSRRSKK